MFITVSWCLGSRSQTSSLPSHLVTRRSVPRLPMQGALTSLLREEGMAYHRLEFLGNDSSAERLEDDEGGGGGGREGPLSPKQWSPLS